VEVRTSAHYCRALDAGEGVVTRRLFV